MNVSRLLPPVGAALLLLLLPPRGGAQIVNSLSGLDESPGWAGGAEALVSLARGNSDYTDLLAGARLRFRSDAQQARLLGSFNRRTAEGTRLADNHVLHLRHNLLLGERWATVAFLQTQRDPFRRVERRSLAGAGMQVDVRRRTEPGDEGTPVLKGRITLGATLMAEAEDRTGDDAGTRTLARFSFFARAVGAPADGVEMELTAFYQPAVEDPGNHRALVGLDLEVDLVAGLAWIVRYDLVHDSAPPEGVAPTDYRLRSGLGFEF